MASLGPVAFVDMAGKSVENNASAVRGRLEDGNGTAVSMALLIALPAVVSSAPNMEASAPPS